jgi:hypothetical protein
MQNWSTENLKELMDVKFAALKESADLKVTHLRELREADQKALDLVAKNNALHFETLNENAKRTIEERSHFVSREAFDPFEKAVLTFINESRGKGQGLNAGWGYLVAAIGLALAIASNFF